MNKNQKLIIEMLKSSIKNEKFLIRNYEEFDWEYIVKESRDHQISSLVYFLLDDKVKKNIKKSIIDNWKKEVFISNVIQKKYINNIENIFRELRNKNIKLILLKGIVLRNYYPKPELRSMSDVDILLNKEDYDIVKKYLTSKGYKNTERESEIHEEFVRCANFEIELHFKLVNNKYLSNSNTTQFEKDAWDNLDTIMVNSVEVNTMNIENFLIHMCFHMAVHTKTQGIGLRQIYDIAVFISRNSNFINWNQLYRKLYKYKILKFAKGIFILVNKLFNIDFPTEFLNDNNLTNKDIDLLLENILLSGVYGRKMHVEGFESLYGGITGVNYRYAKFKRIIRFLIPIKKNMKEFYEKRNMKWTSLPIAWIYRINIIIFRENGIKKSIQYFKQALEISDVRTHVIKSLDI